MTARRTIAAALIAAAGAVGAGTAIADVTIQTVIKSGDTPPGVEIGSTLASVEAQGLGDGGHVNLRVNLVGPTVNSTNNASGFAGLPGSLEMYIRNSAPADPIPGGFFAAVGVPGWQAGRPNNSGHVPFLAGSLTGAGITTSNDSAIFLWDGTARSVALREGDVAPGFNPLLGLLIPNLPARRPSLTDDGRFGINMNFPQFGSPTARQWLYAGTPGLPTLVVAWGEPVPGIPGAVWYSADSIVLNGTGKCFLRATLATGTGGVTDSNDMTYWVGDAESPTLLMREGGPVPGLHPGNISNLTSALLGESPINSAGDACFEVRLQAGVGDTTSPVNERAILFGTPGNLVVVLRKGDPVPGIPGVTAGNFFTVASGDYQIGISMLVQGAGVTDANNVVILIGPPGALRVVFRSGDAAPGYPAGYTVSLPFNDVWFSSTGNYVTRVNVLDDQGAFVGRAVFVGDPVTGEPVLVAGAGMGIEVAPGDVRTVGIGSNDLPFAGVAGVGALLNAQNQFLFTANFTDGTQGAFLATVTAAPGPFFNLEGSVAVDDSSGNGSGLPDPAESGIVLTVPLRNIGLDPSTGLSATLTSLTPTATVVSGSSAYADLASGASGTNASPFEIALDPSHPCGGSVRLQLSVVSNEGSNDVFLVLQGGNSYATCAAFGLGGPAVVDDSAGNGDGFVDPGETIALTVPVAKTGGGGPSTAITGTLTSLTPTATVTTSAAGYPNLGPNDSAGNTSAYVITVAQSHPCGAPIDLQLTVEADGGLAVSNAMAFRVQTGATPYTGTTASWAGPSIPIPDNDPVGISVDVEVSGLPNSIGDVKLRFDALSACDAGNASLSGGIAHLAVGHLVITLTSPQGTSVVILNQQGGTGNHLCSAVFDSEAAAAFPACSQPYSCSHRPFGALSAFRGEDPNGTWTLHVADVNGSGATNIGLLQAFSLLLGTTTCATSCPADFNGADGVTVQDIYDFLADWSSQVAGGPVILASADFNGSGGVTVQDIYDFLAAWNTGCP